MRRCFEEIGKTREDKKHWRLTTTVYINESWNVSPFCTMTLTTSAAVSLLEKAFWFNHIFVSNAVAVSSYRPRSSNSLSSRLVSIILVVRGSYFSYHTILIEPNPPSPTVINSACWTPPSSSPPPRDRLWPAVARQRSQSKSILHRNQTLTFTWKLKISICPEIAKTDENPHTCVDGAEAGPKSFLRFYFGGDQHGDIPLSEENFHVARGFVSGQARMWSERRVHW